MGGVGSRHGDVSISTPNGEIKIDTSKMEEMARRAEEASKRMEAAQYRGLPAYDSP